MLILLLIFTLEFDSPVLNIITVILISFNVYTYIKMDKILKDLHKKVKTPTDRELIERMLKNLSSVWHKHLNEIQTLYAMVKMGKLAEVDKAIKGISDGYRSIVSMVKVEDVNLSYLLHTKKIEGEDKGLTFELDIKGNIREGLASEFLSNIEFVVDYYINEFSAKKDRSKITIHLYENDNEIIFIISGNGIINWHRFKDTDKTINVTWANENEATALSMKLSKKKNLITV
jgi:sensor histidine kinase regulating citrate/malate metabolism